MLNFRENVLFVLKQRGLTQTEAARRLGVSKQSFQHYLSAKNLTMQTVAGIAEVLDTTPGTLLSTEPLSSIEVVPYRQNKATQTELVCPCCGARLRLLAKEPAPENAK